MSLLSLILLITFLITACRLLIIERKYRKINKIHQHLQTLVNSIPDLTWVKDKDSRFLFVNTQFSKAFGLTTEEIIGKTDFDLSSDPEKAQGYYQDDLKTQLEQKKFHTEEQITGTDGVAAWAETIKVPVFNDQHQVMGTAGMARDITQRKNAEYKLIHIAYHDDLTNLPNRTSFHIKINKLLNLNNCAVAVILFDLNNFKTINDSLGHSSGDQALLQISQRLKSLVDENTIVARLSGDEFAIAHNYSKLENSLEKLQVNLLQQFDIPVALKEINYDISASFGVAVAPQDGRDYETLLKHADLAMSQGKKHKNKHCVYFIQKFADELLHKMKLSNQLYHAITNQELSLVYQPKIDSSTEKLIGSEALLRWEIEDGQWISPFDFIPIAEKNGFIIELGNWVIKTVLQQIRNWLDNKFEVVPVSINVSAIQLRQPTFSEYLFQQLERYQIPGHLLELELTEGVLMENIEQTTGLLNKIRKKRIAISIDDFGTGYSSLSYLPKLPIDILKIDRAFITNIHRNIDNQKIVQTIVSLANNFNLSVIAEGVETADELTATISCGINNIQGYYYSRPLAVSELEKRWLRHADNEIEASL
ncbi:GGDEF and EAL domain-containing protein [Psychromonas antarctica]|uniref:sensor domain-containing protein n=1 Tax=Psychromonas antarctica TaxID=67573 RepID=UPI001EE85026|nr:GGDEF and EAL domain-containing protein [Psychromonas antarctica]MCG6200052.1 EAL domain-containing protein [Psychromonas antarctica]